MAEILTDFPKISCPFIRQTFKVPREDYLSKGRQLRLREPQVYLVVDRVHPGYEWVFEHPATIAVEKLDGTNIKLRTEAGRLVALQNRKNPIDPLQVVGGQTQFWEGILQACAKGWVQADGEQVGELVGPKLQGNPYKLDRHLWYPFERSLSSLRYKSFHEHPRTFDNWSSWLKDFLFSLFHQKHGPGSGSADKVFAEGIVLYNLERKAAGQPVWMAKLRRDMFRWFYDGIEVIGYDPRGREEIEDQERFD